MKTADPFYQTKRWEKKRQKILRAYKYMCVECKRYGRLRQADTVHHVYPREHYPEYEWMDWNLIPLCGKCHNKMHDRGTHELTKAGKDLMERTKRRRDRCLH